MTRPDPASARAELDRNAFLVLLAVLTVALAWIVWPFYAGVFWAAVLSLLFEPLYLAFVARMAGRRNLAALATVAIIFVLVILPVVLVTVALVQEATGLYHRIKNGQVNVGAYFQQIVQALPSWAAGLLEGLGIDDLPDLQAKAAAAITQRSQALAGRAFNIGQHMFDIVVAFFIAMYLLFFLLRDGTEVAAGIRSAIPLAPHVKARLIERFTTVVRATVKGNLLIAAAHGALGGLAFWVLGVHAPILWAVVMGFLSLVPAVGTALIWAPVAAYLIAVGHIWPGIGLIAFGVFVIGLVDNVLRPILVGKDSRLPDYVVLVSTLGGLAVMGLNGFVIGPMIVAMFISAWQILAAERGHATADAA
ncbi:MAG TPA: AI-2E family transporter [Caldimonas sp.]